MKNRYTALLLALLILVQVFAPEVARAKASEPSKQTTVQLVKMGALDPKTYPKLDNKTILAIQKQARENQKRTKRAPGAGLFSANSPYLPGQTPTDKEKAATYGKLKVKFKTFGLKENGTEKEFQWNEIFGTDSNGNSGTANIYFVQRDAETREEKHRFKLTVNKAGDYTLEDIYGNPALLPLYSTDLKPYKYDVELDTGVSEKITLLTVKLSYSGKEVASFIKDSDGKIVATIPMDLQIAQTASTKFVSEWHTDVSENDRPAVNGDFDTHEGQDLRYFPFPKNNTDVLKLRMESYNLETDDYPGYDPQTPPHLRVVPEVNVEEDMLDDPATYTIDKDTKRITANGKTYKYRLDYDVIKGGKLTMTEIIPVTFDANGGKFASITEPNAEQKIKKEVDYEKDLTGEVEKPTKDRETFKGWGIKDKQGKINPVTDADFAKIKSAKTFYAIWDNNAITADELTVHESYNDGTKYVNDFIPDLAKLKEQVKIKDANGDPKALDAGDTFAIVDGTKEYTADGDALKNYLYGKLSEKSNPNGEPTRKETVKAKVTHKNGTSQTVDISIKVIKNIYEAKTLTEKPYYVPADYVKVIVDPTTKATDPQKTYYYVNPEAKVVILGKDPTGTGDNKFVKWTMKADTATGDGAEYKLADKPRQMFTEASTITAQYVSDVIPANDDGSKPDTVPANFVEVKFVPTDKATDETKAEKIFWVNPEKEVTIPVKNPVGKQYFTFKEWKMGANADGATYTPSTAQKFTEPTTVITATYDEAKNIIPYNPEEPITRPDGYVRVTFAAETGLKLTEQKAYYVKQNAKDEHGTALTLASLAKPTYEAQTGYKFAKWDKEDTTVIGTGDIVVTAKATKLDTVIPEKDKNGNDNEKPKGYKEVIFKIKDDDKTKGSIKGVAKFYVNPTEYVTINPPATEAKTGYEFGAWDKDATRPTVYDKDTTITGSFNELKAVIPKKNPDGTENKQPDGYVAVTYELEKVDGKEAGKFVEKQTTTFFVNPNKKVSLEPPKTVANVGYRFDKWNEKTSLPKMYKKDTTVKGKFEKLLDIVDGSNPKPDGYIKVTFEKGLYGELSGQTIYYVNPKAGKTVKDLTKPKVTPDTGFKFKEWSSKDILELKDQDWVRITAQYETIDDVVPKDNPKGGENKQPAGYIAVKFSTEANGKIKGTAKTEKIVYVNKNKAVALDSFAPTVDPNTGFDFADWDTQIKKKIQYSDGDTIKALYNAKDDVIPQKNTDGTDKPAGYLTVTFDKGKHGTLDGKTVYYVKPNKQVTVPAPDVKPSVGYEFEKWDKELTQTFAEDTKITAQYKERDNIIPQGKPDGSDKPNGYVTVTFDKGDHGKEMTGQTVYYVNPTKKVKLTAPTVTPEVGWKQKANGDAWDKALENTFANDTKITAQYEPIKDVILKTKDDESEKPKDYVTVKLIPTDKATDAKEKIFFVNPTKEVTITNKPEGKKETKGGIEYTYHFNGWTVTRGTIDSWTKENIKGTFKIDTEITAKYTTSVDLGKLAPAPIPKKDVVTPKGDTPDASTLIENKDKMPDGTTFTYTNDGTPDVSTPGKTTTAKVEVKYPGGKTVVVEVPITVVDNVVPQKGTDKPNVPKDYVMVTYEIEGKGGKIANGETTIYFVNSKQKVTVPQPKTAADTGYEFDKWDPDTKTETKYTVDTTVKGSFKTQKDIIPSTNDKGDPNNKPNGYVTVTFDKGANGSLEGQTVYYVNPKANKTLADVTHPTIKPNTGFTENGWDKDKTTPITGAADITVTAQYSPIADVIPKNNAGGGENKKPDGYVTVTFDKGAHGTLQGTTVFYVNPNKAVALSDKAPTIIADKGYLSAGWDTSINKAIQYKDGDKITALYNDPGKISTSEVAGYVKVEFNEGKHGTLSGTTTYWIKPGVDVTIPEPTVKPDADYRFDGWNKSLTVNLPAGSATYVITAEYSAIPYDPDVDRGLVETQIGKLPTKDDYAKQINVPGGTVTDLEIVEQPDVSSKGLKTAKVKIKIKSGGKTKTKVVDVRVYVVPDPKIIEKPVPGDCNNGCDQPNLGKGALNTTDHYQYLIGYPDGNFAPNKGMTRAEVATMFTRLLKERPVKWKHYNAGLSDIRPGDWYADTVGYAVQKGIVSGYPDGSFKPNKPITRAEFASIASRFDALAQGNAIAFSDLAPSHWGYRAIGSAASKGWISGYPDNTFRPEKAITRAEVTSVTNRMLNRYADLYWIDAHRAEIIRFGDVKRSDWYFEPIMEATMGHDFIRDRDGKTEHWTGVNGKSFI